MSLRKIPRNDVIEEPEWLKATLGKSSHERTAKLGGEVRDYRKFIGLPEVEPEVQNRFNDYMHDIGAEFLRIK